MMRTYKKITMAAPYLLTLVNGNKKKRQELEGLLTEVSSCMHAYMHWFVR
jgi:hypothetical protein